MLRQVLCFLSEIDSCFLPFYPWGDDGTKAQCFNLAKKE